MTGARVLLAAFLSALQGPAPSPYVLFLLWFWECGRLWRLRGACLNLNAQLVRQGVAGGRPRETCWREPRACTPSSSAAAVAGDLRTSSLPPSWAWMPPASPAGVGKVAKSRPGFRPGGVGLALPWAPSDRQLNR